MQRTLSPLADHVGDTNSDMADCSKCGKTIITQRLIGKEFLGVECGCAFVKFMRDADNPFSTDGELVLDHIHTDEAGTKLRVTSRRQLEEAQKAYGFNHVPTNMDRNNWDQPKQQRTYTVSDHYQRKFAREQR
jgi:hypothetical protein